MKFSIVAAASLASSAMAAPVEPRGIFDDLIGGIPIIGDTYNNFKNKTGLGFPIKSDMTQEQKMSIQELNHKLAQMNAKRQTENELYPKFQALKAVATTQAQQDSIIKVEDLAKKITGMFKMMKGKNPKRQLIGNNWAFVKKMATTPQEEQAVDQLEKTTMILNKIAEDGDEYQMKLQLDAISGLLQSVPIFGPIVDGILNGGRDKTRVAAVGDVPAVTGALKAARGMQADISIGDLVKSVPVLGDIFSKLPFKLPIKVKDLTDEQMQAIEGLLQVEKRDVQGLDDIFSLITGLMPIPGGHEIAAPEASVPSISVPVSLSARDEQGLGDLFKTDTGLVGNLVNAAAKGAEGVVNGGTKAVEGAVNQGLDLAKDITSKVPGVGGVKVARDEQGLDDLFSTGTELLGNIVNSAAKGAGEVVKGGSKTLEDVVNGGTKAVEGAVNQGLDLAKDITSKVPGVGGVKVARDEQGLDDLFSTGTELFGNIVNSAAKGAGEVVKGGSKTLEGVVSAGGKAVEDAANAASAVASAVPF